MSALLPWALNRVIADECAAGGSFERFEYPAGPLSKFKLVQFHRRLPGGTDCYGLGVGDDEKSASLKAFYEYLERKAFYERGIDLGFRTTNGIAIHKFKALAEKTAISELLERDAFLIHWYGRIPFRVVPREAVAFLAAQTEQLRTLGFETVIARTTHGFQETLVAFLVNERTAGFVVGTSSGRTLREDIEKAFVEACTNLFLVGPEEDPEATARIRESGLRGLNDHRAYWLHVSSLPAWTFDALGEGDVKVRDVPFRPRRFVLCDEPLPAIGVTAEHVLPLRIGPADESDREVLAARIDFGRRGMPALNDFLVHPIP